MTTLDQCFKKIDGARLGWANEAELRKTWVSELESVLGIQFDTERARKDSSYNNVVIEFKARGFFKKSTTSRSFKEAMNDRLLPYIVKSAKATGLNEDEFIGIAIDGDHVCFAEVSQGSLSHGPLLEFSLQSLGLVVNACKNNYRRAVTAENLLDDFGHGSVEAVQVMQALSDALDTALKATQGGNKIKMLFEEWRTLYGQVADLSTEQIASIGSTVKFRWNGSAKDEMSARLFVIHTYNSIVIKLLAAEIVAAHGLSTFERPAEALCVNSDDKLFVEMLDTQIEHGKLFEGAGIKGFVEEAIFSWHLDAARGIHGKTSLIPALRTLAGKLALYRTDRLERQRDALRDFYQGLVPETLRKSLGEFYTPDWLVQYTVDKVAPDSWLGVRVLDPTCGSGAFLIEVIRRKRTEAKSKNWPIDQTLRAVVSEVWGFDLNPLAVQTARVNFLMEIADLLSPGGTVEMPVLLADAVYSPAHYPSQGKGIVEYKIGSQVASLNIQLPAVLALNRERLDVVFQTMGMHVDDDHEYDVVEKDLVNSASLSVAEASEWLVPLKTTYDQVLDLQRKNWNGIWFRIVRNFFWSATAGKFDVIVGNPPWVRWSKLPDAYRQRVKPTCEQYDIFSKSGHHGGNELDISAMITYTTGDKWLKDDGSLAFVITQAVFQNPSSAGFRNFRINRGSYLVPVSVDDLKALKPFPDAANKTAVMLLRKSSGGPTYPIPYTMWSAAHKHPRAIPSDSLLASVMSQVKRDPLEANPVGGEGSPWALLPPGRFAQIRWMAVPDPKGWEGRKGITTDLNGVYFVPIVAKNSNAGKVQIQTQPNSGKKAIGPAKKVWVEPDWLYPLIKGASDFEACYLKPNLNLFAIVPNHGIKKADLAAPTTANVPATKNYLDSFKRLLQERSTWKARMKAQGAPYYTIYNVGEFSFKPWKVIWAEMPGAFCAAVAGSKDVPLVANPRPFVPDHKIFFVALDDEAEAHYLCALLNSKTVAAYVEAHNVAIQVGDIFKHMRLPKYESSNAKHASLATLSKLAHGEDDPVKRAKHVEKVRTSADTLIGAWIAGLAANEAKKLQAKQAPATVAKTNSAT